MINPTMGTEKTLEERARNLLRAKIQGISRKDCNPFTQAPEINEVIEFLVDRGYVARHGETPKSLRYEVTPKGKKFVSN